jgi:hypothetical protein
METGEKHKQRAAIVVSNRDFIVFSSGLRLFLDLAALRAYDQFHEMFRYTEDCVIKAELCVMKSVPKRGSVGSPIRITLVW